jgi:hypothetical protein
MRCHNEFTCHACDVIAHRVRPLYEAIEEHEERKINIPDYPTDDDLV